MVNFVTGNHLIVNHQAQPAAAKKKGRGKKTNAANAANAAISNVQLQSFLQQVNLVRNPNWNNKKVQEVKELKLEDGGGEGDAQPISSPEDKVQLQKILKSLALNQDDQEILIRLQNRSIIGNNLNFLVLFWHETNDNIQKLNNIFITGTDFNNAYQTDIENLNSTCNYILNIYFCALMSFGLKDFTVPSDSPSWVHPNDINRELNEATIKLETYSNNIKNKFNNLVKSQNDFNHRVIYNRNQQRNTNIGKKALEFKKNETLKKFSEAEAHLKTMKKTNQLFLKLFENENRGSLLLTGEYVFEVPPEKNFEVNFSDAKVKKKILNELIEYLNFYQSMFKVKYRSEHPLIKELINLLLVNDVASHSSIKKIMDICGDYHYFIGERILEQVDRLKKAEAGELDFLKDDRQLNSILKFYKARDNHLSDDIYVKHILNQSLFEQLIVNDMFVFLEKMIFEKIVPVSGYDSQFEEKAISLLCDKIKEIRTYDFLNEDAFEFLPFQKLDEIQEMEAKIKIFTESFISNLEDFFLKSPLNDWMEQKQRDEKLQFLKGNQRITNFMFLQILKSEFYDDEKYLKLFRHLLSSINLIDEALASLPKKLTIEEGQAIYKYLTLNYLSKVFYKLSIFNEIDLFRKNALFACSKHHFDLVDNVDVDGILNRFAEVIYKHCSPPEITPELNNVDVEFNAKCGVQSGSPAQQVVEELPLEAFLEEVRDEGQIAHALPQEKEEAPSKQTGSNEFVEEAVQGHRPVQIDPQSDAIPKNEVASLSVDHSKPLSHPGQNQQMKPKGNRPSANLKVAKEQDDGGSEDGVGSQNNQSQGSFFSLLPKNPRYRDVVDLLRSEGFFEARARGHRIFRNQQGRSVPLPHPHHGRGGHLAPGTLNSVLRLMGDEEKKR